MSWFRVDADYQSPGIGEGCGRKSKMTDPVNTEQVTLAVVSDRAKLILKKIQDQRRANCDTGEPRRKILERLRAKNKGKNENYDIPMPDNADSGICSSPCHEMSDILNISMPTSQESATKNKAVPPSTEPLSQNKSMPPPVETAPPPSDFSIPPPFFSPHLSDTASALTVEKGVPKRKPTNVVLNQFLPLNARLSPIAFPKYQSQPFNVSNEHPLGLTSGSTSPNNQNTSNYASFEMNTINRFAKSRSSSSGESPMHVPHGRGGPFGKQRSMTSAKNQPVTMIRDQPINDRSASLQTNRPPVDNTFMPQNKTHVYETRAYVQPKQPLIPPQGFGQIKFTTPPPPINMIPPFFHNGSEEPIPKSTENENNATVPLFFQPQNCVDTNTSPSGMEDPSKNTPAVPPSLSQYTMYTKQYTPADAIQAVSRLCDYKLPLKHKRSGLKRLMQSDLFNSQLAIQILNTEGGNIVQGIRKMIEDYRQSPDDEHSRPLLILSLQVLNKCLDFGTSDINVKSYINGLTRKMSQEKGELTSLTFLQQLLKMCDPRGGLFSDDYTSRLSQELQDLSSGYILGVSNMSADKPEQIVEAFKQCLGISLGVSESSLVKNIPEQYRIVSLSLMNPEDETEASLAQLLLEDDAKNYARNVWAVNHPIKMSTGRIGFADINQTFVIILVALFPSGHFLAYTDELSEMEHQLDTIDRNLNTAPHCNQSVQEIRLGMMVCVKWEALSRRSREPFRKFYMARALVTDLLEETRVAVYLIDFGITGEVDIDSLTPPPKDLIPIPPRLTFCRLQGVGPAPKTGLLRECILAISRLSTTVSVTTLVNRPTLEAGRILSQLLGSGEEVIQVAALTTLATVAATQLASKMVVRATGDMVPCAVDLICPAVVCFLQDGRATLSRKCVIMSLEILKNMLDQLRPDYMKSVFDNTGLLEVLHSLKHNKEVMRTHVVVINMLCDMPRKGNSYNPDVIINSLKRREIAAKQQKSKYVPGAKPAMPGGELARIVGGQRKEEMQPLIFSNTDIRERQQTPRQDSEERVDGPINPYNPHKVVSASGPVWANVDDISNHLQTNPILNDTSFLEGNLAQKENDRQEFREARSKQDFSNSDGEETNPDTQGSQPPDTARREEREGSSHRRIMSAATAEENLPSVTIGHILNEKHGAIVELWAPANRNEICRSRLSTLICGFLNSLRGGSIFIGVKQNGWILGIRLTRQERDQFRQQVDRILASMINPRVPPNTVDIDFIKAEDKTRPTMENYVIRIKVLGRSTDADTKVYMAHNLIAAGVKEGMYLRGPTGNNERLNQSEIMEELKKQTAKMHSKEMARLASGMGKLGT